MTWRVLIVDDDEADRGAARRALGASGLDLDVVEATEAQAALRLIKAGGIDCVLSDYQLPGLDGLELVRQIRLLPDAPPVVALTGSGDESLAVKLMQAGAVDYISKPSLSAERLGRSLRHAWALRAAEQLARAAEVQRNDALARMRRLVEAAPQIHAAHTTDELLEVVARTAQELFAAERIDVVVWEGGALRHATVGAQARDFLPLAEQVSTLRQRGPLQAESPVVGVPLPRYRGALLVWRAREVVSAVDEMLLDQLAHNAVVAIDSARTLRQAEVAAQTRDDIMAIVSHDLRGPLAAIRAGVELLGELPPGARESAEVLGSIQRSVTHMQRLIDRQLQAATIEAGSFRISTRPQPLARVLDEALTIAHPLAEQAGVELRVGDRADVTLEIDRDRLLEVLSNLLGNALKFTPRGGVVTVALQADDQAAHLTVQDSGPGIAPALREQVFERYWKADAGGRRGTGLGLYIARGIVRAHGGDIWVGSQPGAGSTFTVRLPRA
ncbi:MAG: hybrid sensor histidine kinase/response regulator [Deltaproteobacteria bacterium]|nr:hybrid sensor histidine kinase/response regulator [Deltaproteobacteria bacterium]